MRILFGSAHPHLPQMYGGAQASTHELVIRLRARGHHVGVLSGLTGKGWLGLRGRVMLKVGGRGYVRDDGLGYPVFRTWFAPQAARRVVSDFGADVAVFQSMQPVPLAVPSTAPQRARSSICAMSKPKTLAGLRRGCRIAAISRTRGLRHSGLPTPMI